jgi:hypothetical protein
LRAPPDFSEELHPEEIVRRPARHPWLATIALVAFAVATGLLLRALDSSGGTTAATDPAARERPGAPIARAPGAEDERGAAIRSRR